MRTLMTTTNAIAAAALASMVLVVGVLVIPARGQDTKPTPPVAPRIPATTAPAAPKANKDERSAALFNEMFDAMGGREKLAAIESGHAAMDVSAVEFDASVHKDIYWMKPDKFHVTERMGGNGEAIVCSNGEMSWAVPPQQLGGPRALPDDVIAIYRSQLPNTVFFLPLELERSAESMRYEGMTKFNDVDVHKIVVVLKAEPSLEGVSVEQDDEALRTQQLFVDVATHRLVGRAGKQTQGPLGVVDFSNSFSGYAEVDGLTLPHQVVVSAGESNYVMIFKDVEFGGVDAWRFELSDEIREFIRERGDDADGAARASHAPDGGRAVGGG